MTDHDTARDTGRDTGPDRLAARRATVRKLADEGMSLRAIAAHLGIGKDAVRRDLTHTTATAREAAATPDDAVAPDSAPRAGAWLTVSLDTDDTDLRRDLATLLSTGQRLDSVVRDAISAYAAAYESAWDHGDWPRGLAPRLRQPTYHPYTPDRKETP
ncbi:hypothetical protein [Actinacidiphila sp. ITFR-21]|uniref:hypothetical protein n=1 Tax=Actinacidiphila sp. ITFR-21 TaxID=3075199 RepID=UPI00288B2B73|nr:hypothetical protein [Streptomyces sp. ITFR-21]WNI16633.1 hypothetical protein RLT57_14675 [Streptomyces sp. ITFR-21]